MRGATSSLLVPQFGPPLALGSLTNRGHGRGSSGVAGDCEARQNWQFYRGAIW
jgi:hypothetical protein